MRRQLNDWMANNEFGCLPEVPRSGFSYLHSKDLIDLIIDMFNSLRDMIRKYSNVFKTDRTVESFRPNYAGRLNAED